MSYVPVPQSPEQPGVPARLEFAAPVRQEPTASEIWGIFRRNWWIILGCIAAGAAGAVWLTVRTIPVYRSSTAIRINDKQSPIPETLLLSGGSEVATELEVLGSRTLVEDAVRALGLQLQVLEPHRVPRSDLLKNVRVSPEADPGVYVLTRESQGHFTITREDSAGWLKRVSPRDPVTFHGISFQLGLDAPDYNRIRFAISSFPGAVSRVMGGVNVTRSGRDAKIITLSYESSDPELTAAVPNLITESFVARRLAAQKSAAGSTIVFLKRQLDTLSDQLRSAEGALLNYRQRERVVNPAVEGSTQVTRMVQLQSERSTVETERAALANIVRDVERAAAVQGPDDPSPYRNLLSFPTLLRNQSTSRLLDALVAVEGERTELLARRTPADPDVQALTSRIKSIEGELHSVARTYLEGLTQQVTGIDSALREFGRQLEQVPQRELQFARLERQPKLLEEMYGLLQTRLKEAEIAQAANDLSVQIVDPAIRPRRPVRPRAMLNLLIGIMLGGLVGSGGGFLREILDKTVHTRADIMIATGLSVIGLIPRIPRGRSRVALISKKQLPRSTGSRAAPAARTKPYTASSSSGSGYTFLNSDATDQNGRSDPPPPRAEPVELAKPSPAGVPHVVVSEKGTAAMEAYASLLTNLSYSLAEHPPRVLAFTSGLPGEGKTTNAVNLSLALAHRESKVLLVDCDLRRGLLHNVFEATREPGLTNLLWGQVTFEDARRRLTVDDDGVLEYLTTGTLPPNPTSLIEPPAMRNLLTWWRDQYDYVILDTPPVNVITDASLLGAHADGVVLVARAGVTHGASLGYALEQLRRVRAKVLGVVLSDIDFTRDAAYDPTYRYQQHNYSNGRS